MMQQTVSPTRAVAFRDVLVVTLLFAVSRILYKFAGVHFDSSNIKEFMQILDLHELQNNFWTSIWYLHSQPPLFNILVGGVLFLGGDAFDVWMGAIYSLVNLAGVLCFFLLSMRLFGVRWLSLLLTAFLIFGPAGILYENKLYYEGLVSPLLVCGFYCFHKYLTGRKAGTGMLAFAIFAAVVLLRTAFHPAWLILLAVLPVLMGRAVLHRTLLVAGIPCLVVGALLVKNLLMFGTPGFSSWLGSNMARMTVETLPADMRADMVKSGKLSPLSGLDVFEKPERYVALLGPSRPTGVVVMDEMKKQVGGFPNYNAEVFLRVNPMLAKDSRQAMLAYPQGFLKRVGTAFYHFNRPPSEFKGLESNVVKIAQPDRFYNLLVQGQPAAIWGLSSDTSRPVAPLLQMGVVKLLFFLATIAASAYFCSRVVAFRHRRLGASECFLVCLAVTVGYAMLVTNVLDVWENNRARYMIDPLMTLLVFAFFFRRRQRSDAATIR
ncbi:MAG: hypothetical protein HY020_24725 [Burkholderiales bacterium]|nr:hypothetical protein [Burkholderiales bacterium]